MARTANVFARVEPELKEQAESVFRSGHLWYNQSKRLNKGDYPGRK